MALNATDKGGSSFPPIPEGQHYAITTAIYDLGTQLNEKFGNYAQKVLIQWELPDERIDIEKDGETLNLPRATSKQYTLSLHEKATLRKDLESWRGKSFTEKELDGFDVLVLAGIPCMLQIIHRKVDTKTYANIVTITPVPRGMPKREPENPIRTFSLEDNDSFPEGMPQWIQDIVQKSEEFGMREYYTQGNDEPPPPGEEDIPF